MDIYIDESGLFVKSEKPGSCSTVAALTVPGKAVPMLEPLMSAAKISVGCDANAEIKLKHFQNKEAEYFAFLEHVASLDSLLFSIASDAACNPPNEVLQHQRSQVAAILIDVHRMRHEGGKKGVALLAEEMANLSPQLYVQIACQIELMNEVVSRSINYFAQRIPETLADFKWRIDRKDTSPSSFEAVFEKLSPALLQTMSLSEPLAKIRGPQFDYSYLDRFEIPVHSYLKDDYGLDIQEPTALDIQQIIRGDIEFVDSKQCIGVQIVDLVASGLRRCLRRGFKDNKRAAICLGRLMLQAPRNGVPIRLVGFGTKLPLLDMETDRLVKIMRAHARPMIKSTK